MRQLRRTGRRVNTYKSGVLRLVYLILLMAAMNEVMVRGAIPAAAQTKLPNPELAGMLSKELKITPEQATGGAGSLFGLAKNRVSSDDWKKIASSVPGMNGILGAAPKQSATSSLESMVPGKAGGLASVAGSFKKLGLSPKMAAQFVPVLTKYVESKGGAGVASLLGGALK